MAKQTDPVCGMQIEESEAAGSSDYQGTTYYFCSEMCRSKFKQDPEQYVNKTDGR